MLRFAAVSITVHLLVLAPWPGPRLSDYRADAVLSVGLTTLEQNVVSANAHPAATTRELQPAKTNIDRSVPRPAYKNNRDSGRGAPTETPSVAKLAAKETTRKREDIREGPLMMDTVPPSALPEVPRTAPHTNTRRQLSSRDAPVAISAPVQFEPPVTTVSTNTSEPRSVSAHIRGKLQTDLARYFSYPAIARQRGWQGHVQIGFRVEADGKLSNIYIARSSGYRLLDTSALKSLRQVEPLAEAATLLKGKSVDMELPIIYRLEQP